MMIEQHEGGLISKVTKIMQERVTPMCISLIFVLYAFLTLSGAALGATYWVSPTGAATWANCAGNTPLNGTSACSLSTANSNAVAGDTIYLRGGTYRQTSSSGCGSNYTCGIFPKNRGTANALITYSAYTGEIPVITADAGLTSSIGITILQGIGNGVGTYIRVTGITFHNLYLWASLNNYANYNEIDHCTFYSDTGQDFGGAAGLSISSMCNGGASWRCYSKHNWIHHNTFSKVHEYGDQPCHEGADMIRIGGAYSAATDNDSTTEQCDYNTVEFNTIAYAGHALMDTYGGYNVIRGNIMHNEGWIADYSGGRCNYPPMPNGMYGHRGLQTTEDYARPRQYILVEGNRFGFSSANPNNPGDANYAITSPSTIVRYNYSFGAHQSGIGTKWYSAYPNQADALAHRGGGGTGPYNIRIYNNTTFWNGHTYPYMKSSQPGCTTCPGKLAGINVYSGALDVIVKNNIAYNNYSYTLYGYDITVDSGKNPADYPRSITEINNWTTQNGDPKFGNPDITDPTSPRLPNLALQSSSGAIDGGTYLTHAKNSGSGSTTLIVDDAMYFQDGSWGSDLARGVTFFSDWIAIGTVDNVVQIRNIDYSRNAITLSSPMSWNENARIWLYKKSDGARVLLGAGPDIGASEFVGLLPPGNLRISP
jgi:hypothetical protein